MTWRALVLLAACCAATSGIAADFKGGHASGKQVRLVRVDGSVLTLKEKYPARDFLISRDGLTAVWTLANQPIGERVEYYASTTLVVYRKGKRRTVACNQTLGDVWFWDQGRKIAYTCGPLHFGSNEILIDSATLKEIDQFNDNAVPDEQRPAWAHAQTDSAHRLARPDD